MSYIGPTPIGVRAPSRDRLRWLAPSLLLALLSACGGDGECESTCGNGTVECAETCDDGNTAGNDGCSATCALETECLDNDGDGHPAAACGGTDCNDDDAAVNPDAAEVCQNQIDDDCSDETPDIFDGDGDGDMCDVDCDDATPTTGPSQPELCANNVDDDCDPATPDIFDNDQDSYLCDVDCDDTRAEVRPDATEQCLNGLDDDCNGVTDCADGSCATFPLCLSRRGGASGGPQQGSVDVNIFSSLDGRALDSAEIVIEQRDQELVRAQTDADGNATLIPHATGPFTVSVLLDGFLTHSIVGIDAARLELPIETSTTVPMAAQPVGLELEADMIGSVGVLFSSGGHSQSFIVADDNGDPVADIDPETPAIEPLELSVAIGAPLLIGVRLHDDDGMHAIGSAVIKETPEAGLIIRPDPQSPRTVQGSLVVPADSAFDPLYSTRMSIRPIAHASAFGDVLVGDTQRVFPMEPLEAVFGPSGDNGLELCSIDQAAEYAYSAVIQGAEGFDELRSERRVRGFFDALEPTVTFDEFKEPASFLLIDDTDGTRPVFIWDPTQGPGETGHYAVRVSLLDGKPVWQLMVRGDQDGVVMPEAMKLRLGTKYIVEVTAYFTPGFDYDTFSVAEADRRWTHSTSRTVIYDAR